MKTVTLLDSASDPVLNDDENSSSLKIHKDATRHIMGLLTKLYANPISAVLREYTSNALDSHIKAGQSDPVLVSLPNKVRHSLIVQDFGVGLSKVELESFYNQYGASNKRDENTTVGAFGLGAKSALAISSSFEIRSVKDGVETVAEVKRDDMRIFFISSKQVDEGNGVTITIPTNDVDQFRIAAETMFFGWTPGSILVDGVQPKSVHNRFSIMDGEEQIAWIKTYDGGANPAGAHYFKFLIGGVYYVVETSGAMASVRNGDAMFTWEDPTVNAVKSYLAGNDVVFNLPVGSVELTPSRENIMATPKSRNAIYGVMHSFLSLVRNHFCEYIQDMEKKEAYWFLSRNHSLFRRVTFTPSPSPAADSNIVNPATPVLAKFSAMQSPTSAVFYDVKWRGEDILFSLDPDMPEGDTRRARVFVTKRRYSEAEKNGDFNRVVSIPVIEAAGNWSLHPRSHHYYNFNRKNVLVYSDALSVRSEAFVEDEELVLKNWKDYIKSLYGKDTIMDNYDVVLTLGAYRDECADLIYDNVTTVTDLYDNALKQRKIMRSEAQMGKKRTPVSYVGYRKSKSRVGVDKNELEKISDSDLSGKVVYFADVRSVAGKTDWKASSDFYSQSGVRFNDAYASGYHFPPETSDDLARIIGEEFTLVFIDSKKSVDAFVKRQPEAKPISYYLNAELEKFSEEEKKILASLLSVPNKNLKDNLLPFAEDLLEDWEDKVTDSHTVSIFRSVRDRNRVYILALLASQFVPKSDSAGTILGDMFEQSKRFDVGVSRRYDFAICYRRQRYSSTEDNPGAKDFFRRSVSSINGLGKDYPFFGGCED